jgi:hypothetical protein
MWAFELKILKFVVNHEMVQEQLAFQTAVHLASRVTAAVWLSGEFRGYLPQFAFQGFGVYGISISTLPQTKKSGPVLKCLDMRNIVGILSL